MQTVTNWAGSLYIVASSAADALVGGSATAPVLCAYEQTAKDALSAQSQHLQAEQLSSRL